MIIIWLLKGYSGDKMFHKLMTVVFFLYIYIFISEAWALLSDPFPLLQHPKYKQENVAEGWAISYNTH